MQGQSRRDRCENGLCAVGEAKWGRKDRSCEDSEEAYI